jgi:hypothetical protein
MARIRIKKNKDIDIDEKMLYSSTGLLSGSVIMGLFSNISHEVMHFLEDIMSLVNSALSLFTLDKTIRKKRKTKKKRRIR